MTKRMSKDEKKEIVGKIEDALNLASMEKPKVYVVNHFGRSGHCSICGNELTEDTQKSWKYLCPVHGDDEDFRVVSSGYQSNTLFERAHIRTINEKIVVAVTQFDAADKNNLNWRITRVYTISKDENYQLSIGNSGKITKKSMDEFKGINSNYLNSVDMSGLLNSGDYMFRSGLAELILAKNADYYNARKMYMDDVYDIKDINAFSHEEKVKKLKSILVEDTTVDLNSILRYLIAFTRGISLEKLAKSDLLSVAFDIFNSKSVLDERYVNSIIDTHATSLKKSVEAPLSLIREVLEIPFMAEPTQMLEMTNKLYSLVKNKDEILQLFRIVEEHSRYYYEIKGSVDSTIFLLENGYKMKPILEYLVRADMHQALVATEALQYIKDYVSMSIDMDMEYIKYPKDLRLKHDLTAREYEFNVDEIMMEKFDKSVIHNKSYEYEGEDFIIRTPDSADDMIREGKEQSHCVASYVKNVAKKECIIAFLRRKEDKDKAFATIEISPDNKIRQVKCRFNASLTDEKAKQFLKKWAKENKLTYN